MKQKNKKVDFSVSYTSITSNIYRTQANDSVIKGYFCIGFINFMIKGKSLLSYTNLFNIPRYNDKITLKYFQ